MKFTIKIYKNNKLISKTRTGKKRLFLKKVRLINWKDGGIKVYLKVDYGKRLDNFGKYTSFWNDGDYDNKDDFWLALNAFLEED
jgi:hypothetical protein